MSNGKAEKERRRQLRMAQDRTREERAQQRKRRMYIGLGLGLLVLAVVTVAIVSSTGSGGVGTPAVRTAPLARVTPASASAGSSAVLAANAHQANEILGGTVQAKLAQLPGVPVVINQWASWCSNCKFEFPFFQHAGHADAAHVAFVDLDSQDSQANAQAFLQRFPVDYPSVFDASASQAQSLGGGQGWPTTIYMNARHQITFVHEGAYPTYTALQQDIARYT